MRKRLQEHLTRLAYSGLDRKTFKCFQKEIDEINHKFIQRVNLFAIFGLTAMLLSNLFTDYTSLLIRVHLGFILVYLAEYPLGWLFRRAGWNLNSSLGIWYCMSKVYLFSYFSGIFYNLDSTAVTFYIFLIGLPILFIQPTWKMFSYIVSVSLVFCLLTAYWKTPDRAIGDIYCCVFCLFSSVFISYWINALRMRSIQNEHLLIFQRDTDSLTGMYNRLCFNHYITHSLNNSPKQKVTIFMIDVDNFKSYNDTNGHLAGDEVLRALGDYFVTFARENGIFFARFGGEEFVAVEIGDRNRDIAKIADSLVQGVKNMRIPHSCSEHGVVTISIGYAQQTLDDASSYIELLNNADKALYRAKEGGRNRTVSFEDILC